MKFINHRAYLYTPVEVWEEYNINFVEHRGLRQMIPILNKPHMSSMSYIVHNSISAHTMEELAKDFEQFLVLK